MKRGRGLPPELKEVGEGGFKRGGFFFELGGCNLYIWGRGTCLHNA